VSPRRRAILTAAEMRAAEAAAIAAGTAEEELMARAGEAAAEAVWRFAGPLPALVLCGPGNNGGDGYVVARTLAERGLAVRVAASAEPASAAGRWAREGWTGPVEPIDAAAPAPLLIDALFGTGLGRGLDPALSERLGALASAAAVRVAIDLPSGAASDDGRLLSPVPDYDLTVTFQTLKPAHLLQPAARHMGRIAIADIGIAAESRLSEVGRPSLPAPGPDDHKFRRGYVAVLAGEMPGAAALAAAAAARAGAGYVRLIAESGAVPGLPAAVVQGGAAPLDDPRIGALLVGPGLGRGAGARAQLARALGSGRPLVLDADALHLLAPEDVREGAILTPHAGEFARLFGDEAGGKIARTRAAAAAGKATIVFKGADTVAAAPDGEAVLSAAPHWLASAGTGDVLAGIVAAMRARGLAPLAACEAALWLHGEAARRAGPGLIADDLIGFVGAAAADCR
jgi:ADP-dependent NAD(P)H-hydrate dehydratase / NAD(P)H-hydrate epimerase